MTDIGVVFTGVAVADFESAVPWYRRLFGRPEDIVVNDDEVMWRITDTAWLYVVRDEQRAGHALVALSVPDIGRAVEQIEDRGLDCGPAEIVGEGARKALIIDPEGNTIAVIEVNG
jgi:predicted enzyme related to lactoylglutathione lyase